MAQLVKNPPANAGDSGDSGSISGLGRSPGEGNGNPLQHFGLENSLNRGAGQAIVHDITESDMTERLSVYTCKGAKRSVLSRPVLYH